MSAEQQRIAALEQELAQLKMNQNQHQPQPMYQSQQQYCQPQEYQAPACHQQQQAYPARNSIDGKRPSQAFDSSSCMNGQPQPSAFDAPPPYADRLGAAPQPYPVSQSISHGAPYAAQGTAPQPYPTQSTSDQRPSSPGRGLSPQPPAFSSLRPSLDPSQSTQSSNSTHTLAETTSNRLQLAKPAAIPATDPKLGSPFLRAYPTSLASFDIDKTLFLKFIDDLNRVAVASPPLQVLGLAGSIVGFVPLATAQIVGAAVNAAATIGTVAASKGGTELCLRDANKKTFAPRGLKVEIGKLEALAKIANMPILNADGKIDKKAEILAPIDNPDSNVSGQQRRLAALEPWIAKLDLEPLPEIATPNNAWSKLHAGASERQRRKGEEKMLKGRRKAAEKYNEDLPKATEDYEKDMRKLDNQEDKVRRKEKGSKLDKELAKVEKEREKVREEYEKETGKVEEDRIKDDKEHKGMRKILWLVIRNLDADSGVGENPDVNG